MKFFTKTELRIFLIFWLIFSVFATSDRWNDNSSLDLTMAIVDEHRFEIDSYANNTGDRTYYNGHYYPDKVPGTAFLTVPLYQVYKLFVGEIPYHGDLEEDNPSWKYHLFLFLAICLISAVCGALTVVLVYKISEYFTSNNFHRNLVVIVLGLGTLLPHAARQFNSHAISTFFIFLSFYLIFKMKKERIDSSFTAGLAGGFAVLTEYRAIILLFGLFVIVLTLKNWKWALKFIAGGLLFYSILLLYTYTLYDHPFANPYQYTEQDIWGPAANVMLCNKISMNRSKTLFEVSYFKRWGGIFNKAMRLLFDPFRGLIFYSPIMLFSFLGLFFMYKKHKIEVLIIIFCFLAYLLNLSTSLIWWIGLSFGPRHITPIIPFLMMPLLYTIKKVNIKIILFLILLSILISIIGLQSPYLSHNQVIFNQPLYCERMYSYTPIANPLFENYIPSFLNYQPRNSQEFLILERLLNFKIVPFANIILLLFAFLFIWKNKSFFKN